MLAGKLDRRITFQQPTLSADPFGDPLNATFSDLGTVWASVQEGKGGERREDDSEVATRTDTFKIRNPAFNLKPTMRIVYASKNYNILNIKELGRQEGFLISAETKDY